MHVFQDLNRDHFLTIISNIYALRFILLVCGLKDYDKTFDHVKYSELTKILKRKELDENNIKPIESLYKQQVAAMRLDERLSSEITISREV